MKKLISALGLVVLLWSQSAGAAGYLPLFGAGIPDFTLNGGFPRWKACRAAVRANTADCNILVFGESTGIGEGGFYNDVADDAHSSAIYNHLSWILRGVFGTNVRSSTVAGNQSIAAASYGGFDTRVTVNNWAATSNTSIGGNEWVSTDGTAFVFNPTDSASYPGLGASSPFPAQVLTDTIDIYWNGVASGGGTITIDTGGSPICTIRTTTGTAKFNKTSCSTTLGANTYNIKCTVVLTGCTFQTLVARNSAAHQVSMINGAASGATAAIYQNNSGNPWDALSAAASYAPSLCIVMLTGNDYAQQTPLATFSTEIANIISSCQAAGADVLVMTGFPLGGTVAGTPLTSYQAAAISAANAANVPVWDTLSLWGGPNVGWSAFNMDAGGNGACCGGASNAGHWGGPNNVFAATMMALMLAQ